MRQTDNPAVFVCATCGSPEVQWSAWVDRHGVVDGDGPSDAAWCPQCAAECDLQPAAEVLP